VPVATVFENLEAGASIEKIVEQFHVTPEQIRTVLEFAARCLGPLPLRYLRPTMLVLFDHGTPSGVAPALVRCHHDQEIVREDGQTGHALHGRESPRRHRTL
jgi:hypothetical protein